MAAAGPGSGSSGLGSCLFNALAGAWVDLYHAAFVSKKTLQDEQQQIRVALVQKELSSCQQLLTRKEKELNSRLVHVPSMSRPGTNCTPILSLGRLEVNV
jgi:hypothetical protein